jgi:hypothetical protein
MAAQHPDLTGAQWRKSTRSSSTGQNCVEVATNLPGIVAIRDSKNSKGPALVFVPKAWRAFLADVRDGQFGL